MYNLNNNKNFFQIEQERLRLGYVNLSWWRKWFFPSVLRKQIFGSEACSDPFTLCETFMKSTGFFRRFLIPCLALFYKTPLLEAYSIIQRGERYTDLDMKKKQLLFVSKALGIIGETDNLLKNPAVRTTFVPVSTAVSVRTYFYPC